MKYNYVVKDGRGGLFLSIKEWFVSKKSNESKWIIQTIAIYIKTNGKQTYRYTERQTDRQNDISSGASLLKKYQ